MTRFAIQRLKATPEALELIEQLVVEHGPLAFLQSSQCSDESVVICLTRAELLPSDGDMRLGEIGGAPFYVDAEQYQRSGRPTLVVDVASGGAGRFSLEGLGEVHFVTRAQTAKAAVG
jgi:uncharacterized protein (DUF779 family)